MNGTFASQPHREAALQAKLERCPNNVRHQELVEEYRRKEHEYLRFKRTKLTPDDVTTLQIIGKGAFGTVTSTKPVLLGQARPEEGHWQAVCPQSDAQVGDDQE